MGPVYVDVVAAGYAHSLRLSVISGEALFPLDGVIRAEVRDAAGAAALAGTLRTDDRTILIVNEQTLELFIPADITVELTRLRCAIDFVREDIDPEQWLGVQITLPVRAPVTVPLKSKRASIPLGISGPPLAAISAPQGVQILLGPALMDWPSPDGEIDYSIPGNPL